jgi:hypothetical protein
MASGFINPVKVLVYAVFTAAFYFGATYEIGIGSGKLEFPLDGSFGGKAKFLTCLNLVLPDFLVYLCNHH